MKVLSTVRSFARPSVKKIAPVLMAFGLLASSASSSFAATPSGTIQVQGEWLLVGRLQTLRRTYSCPTGWKLGQKDKLFGDLYYTAGDDASVSATPAGGAYGTQSLTLSITNWDGWHLHSVKPILYCH